MRKWARVAPQNSNETSENVPQVGVSLRNLTKIFPISGGEMRTAVDDISVDFLVGHVTALLGHNGAGKSTMM